MMNRIQTLVAGLLLSVSCVVQAAAVYVQHQGDVTQGALLAFDSGAGYSLNADLATGSFTIFADASPGVPINNNFSGFFRPVEFTNATGAPVKIDAGNINASVHASFFHGPSIGGQHSTNMRTSGSLFVRILGGAGQGDFLTNFQYQVSVFYNPDGSLNHFDSEYLPGATHGASVVTGAGTGIGGGNFHFAMPALLLDSGARLQLSFQLGGDAADSSSTNVFNTLSFVLPSGVVLSNDVGVPLAWVSNVPVPAGVWLFGSALSFLGGVARARRARRASSAMRIR